jgi:hypothetical protein
LESEDQTLWLRAKAAYPAEGPDHPPDEEGVETPCTNILRFPFHVHSSSPRTPEPRSYVKEVLSN